MTPTERETESLKSLHAYYQNIVRELQEQLKQQHDKVRNQAIDECIMTISCSHQFLLSDKVKELEQLKTIS